MSPLGKRPLRGSADGQTRGAFLFASVERRACLALHFVGPRKPLHKQHPFYGKWRPLEPSSNCANGSPLEKELPQLFEVFIGPAPR